MRYYVLDLQGNKYGPADVGLLNEWSRQGRISPATVLIDETTGRQLVASQVPGLALLHPGAPQGPGPVVGGPFGAPPGPAYGSGPFGRATDGSWEVNTSFVCSAASVALCCLIPGIGVFPALAAAYYASVASRKGSRMGSTAMFTAAVAILLQLATIIFGVSLLRGMGGG